MLASTARSSCTIGITSFRREAHRRTLGLSRRDGKEGKERLRRGGGGAGAPGVLAKRLALPEDGSVTRRSGASLEGDCPFEGG